MRRRHHIARIASTMFFTAAVVVFADVAVTLLWQEPLTAAYGNIQQHRAEGELEDLEADFASDVASDVADEKADEKAEERRTRRLAKLFEARIEQGDAIGRIKIPSIGLNTVLFNGTDTSTLQKGPGRFPETPLPGLGGTTGIAGHRTTYLAPFRKVNEIDEGGEVRVELPYGTFNYEVVKKEIVDPSDVEVVYDAGYERVVLTACHPLHSAAQRYVITARLIDVEPLTGA
jgi:sortase A